MKNGILATVLLSASAAAAGLPNVSQTLTLWNGNTVDWKRFNANAAYPVTNFVRYIEFMGATGGSADRDCLRNPDDRTVRDDYDFTRLVAFCRETVRNGFKPYLKLGNVPGKFTDDYNPGSFRMNIRPPSDSLDHYRYMRACAAALKEAFGREEVRAWRFSVLTEADNSSWFRKPCEDREETKRAFFELYDYTVKAFEEELGAGLVIGTHLINPVYGEKGKSNFSWRDVIAHCASGTNAATGGKGAPLKLLTISYYIGGPGKIASCEERLDTLAAIRRELEANGFGEAVTGVDEGRVLSSEPGSEKRDLPLRIVGDSYEAAFDVRLAKTMFDVRADYFAAWGYFSGGATEGIPSHAYFTSREIAKFEGMTRIDVAPVEGLDLVAAVSPEGDEVRLMVGSLTDDLRWSGRVEKTVALTLPAAFRGRTVTLSRLVLDDSNNWFTVWRADRVKLGVKPTDYRWSWDDPSIFGGKSLQNANLRDRVTRELLPRYAALAAAVKPVVTELSVPADGRVSLPIRLQGNGAVFFTAGAPCLSLNSPRFGMLRLVFK